uniref:Uncharacterized protein n=1 Tax=Xiphophorus couchianus TaxID=32473 RepID=A0A3B5MVG7_9TELE
MSGGMNSVDAVKKKIKVLQDQAEEAEERAEQLQLEVEKEKRTREEAEGEVTSLSRRLQLSEENLDRVQERLAAALRKLDEVEKVADESERSPVFRYLKQNKNQYLSILTGMKRLYQLYRLALPLADRNT